MKTVGQHLRRFALACLLTLPLVGWGPAAFDWDEDAAWELNCEGSRYSLNQTLSELGLKNSDQEMIILPNGLLVRQREGRAVNLTVLKGQWEILRRGQVIGKVGDSLEKWLAQVGEPRKIFKNPEKVGVIYYYRASLVDLGLLVAEGAVLSVMMVEPGYLEQALLRSGYRAGP